MSTEPEYTLELQEHYLRSIVAMLPRFLLYIKQGGLTCPASRPVAEEELRRALADGTTIDKSNGEGPTEEWDGWLVIHREPPIFIETVHAKKD